MTNPKTIETTLVWYLCETKLPEDGSEVLVAYPTGLILYAEFLRLWDYNGDQSIIRPHFDDGDSIIWPSEVKYWAYLPTLSEEE